MTRVEYFTTASYIKFKGLVEGLMGDKEGYWVIMSQPAPRLPASDLFQTNLGAWNEAKYPGFKGIPTERYTLWRW